MTALMQLYLCFVGDCLEDEIAIHEIAVNYILIWISKTISLVIHRDGHFQPRISRNIAQFMCVCFGLSSLIYYYCTCTPPLGKGMVQPHYC